jgi:hypothetical protein
MYKNFKLDNETSFERKVAKYTEYINGNILILNIQKLKDDGVEIPEYVKELKITNYSTPSFRDGVDFCLEYSIDAFSELLKDMISSQYLLNKHTTF